MFFKKKSHKKQEEEKLDFITIYFDKEDMKIEFGYTDIKLLAVILDTIANGSNREAILSIIESKLNSAGLKDESLFVMSCVNTSIRPSEVYRDA